MSKVLKNFVGIDISKNFFDAALVKAANPSQVIHQQFSQTPTGYKEMVVWLKKDGVVLNDETLFCMEYTGLYNAGIVNHLVKQKALLWVEMPLRIKKSSGFERGTDDKTASVKIASYALRYQDQKQLWKPLDSNLVRIKNLITQRDRIINCITQLTVPVNELKTCGAADEAKAMEKLQAPAIKALQTNKQAIEHAIAKLVQEDEAIYTKVKQVQSVTGIGKVTAVSLLVYTKAFSSFASAKELACYCGVVPFVKSSGSSVRFKPSVSPYANKKLKKLLHMCAMSAIKNDTEIKAYFERKVAEGKNKMSVINAVRNKLIHRVFAVVRDGRCFEDNYVRNCA
jgi:transposase